MSKSNKRRVSVVVSAQTLYHLEAMASFSRTDIGRVIDNLVREKQLQLKDSVRSDKYADKSR